MSWYYCVGSNQTGPLSREQLTAAAQAGQFTSTDLVWGLGMQEWQPASSVPGLVAMPDVPPPPTSLPQVALAPTGPRSCPQCKAEVPTDATACVHCGFDLRPSFFQRGRFSAGNWIAAASNVWLIPGMGFALQRRWKKVGWALVLVVFNAIVVDFKEPGWFDWLLLIAYFLAMGLSPLIYSPGEPDD